MSDDLPLAEFDAAGERLHAEYLSGVRDFSGRHISEVRLMEVDLSNSVFTETQFTNCIFVGVIFNDGVFDRAHFERCNLMGASFQRASLTEVNFDPSACNRADFHLASLRGAKFQNCNASGAYFGQADLRGADLGGGKFSEAVFSVTLLQGSTLAGADLENAHVRSFNLIDAETIEKNSRLLAPILGRRKELEELLARATPELVDSMLSAAPEQLAEGERRPTLDELREGLALLDKQFESLRRFLLASGCDAEEVAKMSLAADKRHADYPRVFISYSTADEEFAARLYSILTSFGVDAWFAPEKMQGGRKINEQIEEAIGERDKIIFVLSEASMKSRWVGSELQWAAGRELDLGEQVFFPLRIVPFEAVRAWTLFDADFGQDIAKYVRQYYVPDFSAWQDDEALARLTERLLKDLRLSQQGKV